MGREWTVPLRLEDTDIDPCHEFHQHSSLLRILDRRKNWDQAKTIYFLLQKGEKQRKKQTQEEVIRCKLVLRVCEQGQRPQFNEELLPSRVSALPGLWHTQNNHFDGHFMSWSSLLSWEPICFWPGLFHGKRDIQRRAILFYCHSCFLVMPGHQHWCSWKSLSLAQCLDSDRLSRTTLHKNIHKWTAEVE